MQQETILIYADVLERGRFFSKFYRPLQDEFGMDVMFLTARLSIVRMLKKFTENVAVLKHMDAENTMAEKIDYSRSLSVLNGYHSLSEAKKIGHAVYRQLEELSGRQQIKVIWIWNGTTTIAMTLAAFARDHGIATRFFEISNLGERIFVDRDGTSGASYLASHPELLDIVAVKEKEYHAWQEAYREHDKVPKQAANRSRIPWGAVIDYFGYWSGFLQEDRRNPYKVFWSRLSNKINKQNWVTADLSEPYVFLPLQVSDDSQVKLFSSYSNLDMIDHALKLSREKGCRLIVKLHPAEGDQGAIDSVLRRAKEEGFSVAGNPTPELIHGASVVLVNNSTVGLEAMIERKEVVVLGNALYRHFTPARLKAYILHYLLPGDYFGDAPIPAGTIKKILLDSWWETEESK